MNEFCAWCNAPRLVGATCAKCGADYEKAVRIKAGEKSNKATTAATTKLKPRLTKREDHHRERLATQWAAVKDLPFEKRLCYWSIPCMVGLTFLMEVLGIGDNVLRIVFGMPVHELGHAIVGWLCGFNSIPTLWKTLIPENRGLVAPAILFSGCCYLIYQSRRDANKGLLWLGSGGLFLQFVGTFVLSIDTARLLVTWGGDGVGMILAVGLMAGFNFGKRTGWYKDYLRWGFAFIGAAAFADIVVPWWISLSDLSAVPYGMTGGTHTDTYKLIHHHGWTMDQVINRYVNLSVVCGVVLGCFYVRGIRQATRAILYHQRIHPENALNTLDTD